MQQWNAKEMNGYCLDLIYRRNLKRSRKKKKTFVEMPEVGYSAKGPMNVTTERTGEQALSSSSSCIPKFNDPSMQFGKQAQRC